MSRLPLEVLLVEDNEDDVLLVEDAVEHSGIPVKLQVVSTVEGALERLRDPGMRDPVELVLLDLNLPGQDGFAFLEAVNESGRALDLPVVVLTTSKRPQDRERAKERGARAFVSKPIGLGEFRAVLGELFRHWNQTLRGATIMEMEVLP